MAYDERGYVSNVKACIELIQPGESVVIRVYHESRMESVKTRVTKRNQEIKDEGWQLSIERDKVNCTVRIFDRVLKKVRPAINSRGFMDNYLACMDLIPRMGSKSFVYDNSGPENTVRVIKSTISKWNSNNSQMRGMCLHPIFQEELNCVMIIDVITKENKAKIVKNERKKKQKMRKKAK